MNKIYFFMVSILFFVNISCNKKEELPKTEKELASSLSHLITKIKENRLNDTIYIRKEVKPIIDLLYDKDSLKYRIVKNVVTKILIKNNKLYKFQVNDLKNEIQFLNQIK